MSGESRGKGGSDLKQGSGKSPLRRGHLNKDLMEKVRMFILQSLSQYPSTGYHDYSHYIEEGSEAESLNVLLKVKDLKVAGKVKLEPWKLWIILRPELLTSPMKKCFLEIRRLDPLMFMPLFLSSKQILSYSPFADIRTRTLQTTVLLCQMTYL